MIGFIAEILGALIRFIYNIFGSNYGLSIILFTILTKIILFPITYNQTKSMADMQKMAPLEKEIREKYKGNKDKMAEELTKMYSEHKINPMGGCLAMLIQIPVIFAMFMIVKQPLTYIMQVPQEQLQVYTQEYLGKEEVTENEIKQSEIQVAQAKDLIDMNFLGLDFGDVPSDKFSKDDTRRTNTSYIALAVPILSLLFAIFQNKYTQKTSNLTDEQKQQQKTMNMMMPILSAYISYIMPLSLGIYWLLGNILQILTQFIINKMLKSKKILLEGGK